MFVPNKIKNNNKYYMSTINNIKYYMWTLNKNMFFWFESNQWIPTKRFDSSQCLIEPRIWIYAGGMANHVL